MDSPSIDDLLKHVTGMFELAAIAGKRAVEIKKSNKDTIQPLQKALEEIGRGSVNFEYREPPPPKVLDAAQIELPLEIEGDVLKVADPAVLQAGRTRHVDVPQTEDEDEEDVQEEEIIDDLEEIEDDETSKDFFDDDIQIDLEDV